MLFKLFCAPRDFYEWRCVALRDHWRFILHGYFQIFHWWFTWWNEPFPTQKLSRSYGQLPYSQTPGNHRDDQIKVSYIYKFYNSFLMLCQRYALRVPATIFAWSQSDWTGVLSHEISFAEEWWLRAYGNDWDDGSWNMCFSSSRSLHYHPWRLLWLVPLLWVCLGIPVSFVLYVCHGRTTSGTWMLIHMCT